MRILVSEIISTDLKKENFAAGISGDAFIYQGDAYPYLDKPSVCLTVANEKNSKVHITGQGEVTLDIPCGRCLTSVPTRIAFEIDELVDFEKIRAGSSSDILDAPYIDDNVLDTDILIENSLLMRFPDKVLCREDCKGLCPKCGTNLNLSSCSCDTFIPDPRMAAIQDIFKKNKEV